MSASKDTATVHRALSPILVGAAVGLLLLLVGLGTGETKFDELAMPQGTSSYYAKFNGVPIHCSSVPDAEDCLAGLRSRGRRSAILWLGSSQLHAINQYSDGDLTASAILFDRLRSRDVDLVTFSQPNASLREHYILFEYLRARHRFDTLILPVVFDDTREGSIRSSMSSALSSPAVASAVMETEIGRRIIEVVGAEATDIDSGSEDLKGLSGTPQEIVEEKLNDWLSDNVALWARRREARGSIYVALYRLRNTVFGITASSKRRLTEGTYRLNMAALEAILWRAGEMNISTLVYIVPLRDDVEIPYVEAEYARFRVEVRDLVRAHGATLADLEDLVPANLWGKKMSTNVGDAAEIDFMHFQAPGHQLMADRLLRILADMGDPGA